MQEDTNRLEIYCTNSESLNSLLSKINTSKNEQHKIEITDFDNFGIDEKDFIYKLKNNTTILGKYSVDHINESEFICLNDNYGGTLEGINNCNIYFHSQTKDELKISLSKIQNGILNESQHELLYGNLPSVYSLMLSRLLGINSNEEQKKQIQAIQIAYGNQPVLLAKLQLLHEIHDGKELDAIGKEENKITELEWFENLTEEDKASLETYSISVKEANYDNSEKHRDALTILRDALLAEY